jgi:hypothetical protein
LNAAKHGLTSWLKRRALPLNKQHVGRLVQEYRAGLVACKGGEDGASEVEKGLIENAARGFGACLLILEEAKARGLVRKVDGSWDLSPGFSRLVGFLNAERMALVALGVGRRSRDVTPSLDDLLRDAADDDGEAER